MEIDVCRDFTPYAQWWRTLQLGCANCGKMPRAHENVCDECSGTGRGVDEELKPQDNLKCKICLGTGRTDK